MHPSFIVKLRDNILEQVFSLPHIRISSPAVVFSLELEISSVDIEVDPKD